MPTEVMLEVSASTRYRKVPVLRRGQYDSTSVMYDYEKEKHCARTKGHVLQVQHCGRIVCRECGAEWKDEGF